MKRLVLGLLLLSLWSMPALADEPFIIPLTEEEKARLIQQELERAQQSPLPSDSPAPSPLPSASPEPTPLPTPEPTKLPDPIPGLERGGGRDRQREALPEAPAVETPADEPEAEPVAPEPIPGLERDGGREREARDPQGGTEPR